MVVRPSLMLAGPIGDTQVSIVCFENGNRLLFKGSTAIATSSLRSSESTSANATSTEYQQTDDSRAAARREDALNDDERTEHSTGTSLERGKGVRS